MKNYYTLSRAALPVAVLFASLSSILVRWSSAPSLVIAFYRMAFAFLLVVPPSLWNRRDSSGRYRRSARPAPSGMEKPAPFVRLRSGDTAPSEGPGTAQAPNIGGDAAVNTARSAKRAAAPNIGGDAAPDAARDTAAGRREVFLSLLSGFFLALHFATWISSLQYTSVASSVLLVNTHPVMVFFISRYILKEEHTVRELLFVLVTVAGSVILSWGDTGKGSGVLIGDLLAIAGAFSIGAYMLLGRAVRQTMSLGRYIFFVYGSGAFFLLIITLGADLPLWPYSLREFTIFFSLAVFCTILGHGVYNWALKYVGSTYLSVTVLIEPIAAGILAFFFFREVPTGLNGIGAAVVLFGIYGYSKVHMESERDGIS